MFYSTHISIHCCLLKWKVVVCVYCLGEDELIVKLILLCIKLWLGIQK